MTEENPKVKKVSIGLELVKNYNKIKISFSEEEISYSNPEELTAGIRRIFTALREECKIQFLAIEGDEGLKSR